MCLDQVFSIQELIELSFNFRSWVVLLYGLVWPKTWHIFRGRFIWWCDTLFRCCWSEKELFSRNSKIQQEGWERIHLLWGDSSTRLRNETEPSSLFCRIRRIRLHSTEWISSNLHTSELKLIFVFLRDCRGLSLYSIFQFSFFRYKENFCSSCIGQSFVSEY